MSGEPSQDSAPLRLRSSTLSPRPVWLVFARRKYDESLYQVGTVTADSPEMAAVFARSIYDEHPWIELTVVPRASMRTVIAP
jgi:1,2-phenylacetyl-CoA epoxidase PaaB subunit